MIFIIAVSEFRAALLHARAEVFPGAFGHAVYDESPDFAKLLLDFFTL